MQSATLATKTSAADEEDCQQGSAELLLNEDREVIEDLFHPNPKKEPSTSELLIFFLKLTIPQATSNVVSFLILTINAIFSAKMENPDMLAAVGIGEVTAMLTIVTLLMGVNTAQETLTSQAFGNGNKRLCGVYLNRGLIINTLIFLPVALFTALYSEKLLVASGQDPEVSRLAKGYVNYSMPGLYFWVQFDLVKRWLASMRITFIPMVVQMVAAVAHLLFCFYFFSVKEMGINGLGLATTLSDLTDLVCIAAAIGFLPQMKGVKESVSWPDIEALRGWPEYLRLSWATTLILCSEWWAYEAINILAGLLGTKELVVQTIVTSGVAILFEISVGITEATSVIIGNCIGANNVPLAKRFFWLMARVTYVTMLFLSLMIILLRNQIVAIYSSDPEIMAETSQLLIVVSISFFFDSFQMFLQGPVRGIGLNNQVEWMTFASYYCLGIPLSAFLGLKTSLGVIGLQLGLMVAIFTQGTIYAHILYKKDWQQLSDEAQLRIKEAAAENDDQSDQEEGDGPLFGDIIELKHLTQTQSSPRSVSTTIFDEDEEGKQLIITSSP